MITTGRPVDRHDYLEAGARQRCGLEVEAQELARRRAGVRQGKSAPGGEPVFLTDAHREVLARGVAELRRL